MAWVSLKIEAQDNTADLISDTLMSLGALSAIIEDANAETIDEQPIFGEPGDPPPGIWQQNLVSALFDEGADILMVKPALAYLDIIQLLKQNFPLPIAAYQVSGEYSMIKFAAKAGVINENETILESICAIRRAGADIIFTYFTNELIALKKES